MYPHPIFNVSKIEHKTSPAPFEVVHSEFERDLNQPTITYGKISFAIHIQDLNILPPLRFYTILYITNLILHLHLFNLTFSIPITPSDTENYLLSDDPNITNLMVSHYDCAKQHNLRQFNLLNVKQCTEALQTLNTQVLKPVYMSEQKPNVLKLLNASLMLKKNERSAFKDQLNIAVSIELYGTIILYHILLPLIP